MFIGKNDQQWNAQTVRQTASKKKKAQISKIIIKKTTTTPIQIAEIKSAEQTNKKKMVLFLQS